MFKQKFRTGLSLVVALVTCPCHLPLTLPLILSLTAGTTLGAFLSQNPIVAIAVSTLIFIAALSYALRSQGKSQAVCELPIQKGEEGLI